MNEDGKRKRGERNQRKKRGLSCADHLRHQGSGSRRERPLARRYYTNHDTDQNHHDDAAHQRGRTDQEGIIGIDEDMVDGEDEFASFASDNSGPLVEALRMAGLYDRTPTRASSSTGGEERDNAG